jgi:hypothetical protein
MYDDQDHSNMEDENTEIDEIPSSSKRSSPSRYICIYAYVCMYLCIHICVCTYVSIYVYIHIYIHTCI